jgi:hypothetical protein
MVAVGAGGGAGDGWWKVAWSLELGRPGLGARFLTSGGREAPQRAQHSSTGITWRSSTRMHHTVTRVQQSGWLFVHCNLRTHDSGVGCTGACPPATPRSRMWRRLLDYGTAAQASKLGDESSLCGPTISNTRCPIHAAW